MLLHRQVWFMHAPWKVGGLEFVQGGKPQDQSVLAKKLVQTQEQLCFYAPAVFFFLFFSTCYLLLRSAATLVAGTSAVSLREALRPDLFFKLVISSAWNSRRLYIHILHWADEGRDDEWNFCVCRKFWSRLLLPLLSLTQIRRFTLSNSRDKWIIDWINI